MRNLIITTLLDAHGSRSWRSSGKLWIASLLRHQWAGCIEIHRNFPEPLFPVERLNLNEHCEPLIPSVGGKRLHSSQGDWRLVSREYQLEIAGKNFSKEGFDWVLFADADCIALRNLDHLFAGNDDLLVSRTAGRPDPGFFAVRGSCLNHFLLRLISGGSSSGEEGLAEIVQSGEWTVSEFERGEVLRPSDPGVTLVDLAQAAVVHFSGMKPEDKHRLAFAFHMMAVYGDKDGLFFDIMEA